MAFWDRNQTWLKRFEALDHQIGQTVAQFNSTNDTHQINSLKNLRFFGKRQFFYFYFGFYHALLDVLEMRKDDGLQKGLDLAEGIKVISDRERVSNALNSFGIIDTTKLPQRLIYDDSLPPKYVLRTILDQITYDFNVMQRALVSRMQLPQDNQQIPQSNTIEKASRENKNLANIDSQNSTLKSADLFGKKILSHVVGEENLLEKMPLILTYFNPSPLIRLIPYANLALIGVPYTTTSESQQDLLVMAHELGHYVYWHGYVRNQRVKDVLKNVVRGELPLFRNWIEEIFADIFGLIMCENFAMLTWAMNMIEDNAPNSFVKDNQVHPIDIIRPFIYFETLRILAQNQTFSNSEKVVNRLNTYLSLLESRWEWHIQQMGGYTKLKIKNRFGDSEILDLDDLKQRLSIIIQKIIEKTLLTNLSRELSTNSEIISKSLPNQAFRTSLSTTPQWLTNWEERLKELPSDEGWNEISNLFKDESGGILGLILKSPQKLKNLNSLKDKSETFQTGEIFSNYPALYVPKIVRDTIEQFYQNEIIKWDNDFESFLSLLANQETTVDFDIQPPNHMFKKIRDTHFNVDVPPNVWQIVFAAEGWTIKGPDSRPTGDWEDNWHQSSFHL